MKEPKAIKIQKTLTHLNHSREDDYFWMNERDSEPVLSYIKEENKYTENYFEDLKPLQEELLKEFEDTIPSNDESSPFILNQQTFQLRNSEGKDYPTILLINEDKTEEVFFDLNERAVDKEYYDLAEWSISNDNSILAISEDYIGRRQYSIYFKDLNSNEFFTDTIQNSDGSIVWSNDNKTVYYVKKDPDTLREFQVYKHTLGTDSDSDKLIFEENDERYYVAISKSITDRYIEIHCESSTTSETLLIDANDSDGEAFVFLKRESGHLYEVDHHETGFYITTNKDAKNNKVVFSKEIPSSIEICTEIVAHNEDTLIESTLALKKYFIIEERTNGLQKIKIIDFQSQKEKHIEFTEKTYYLGLSVNETYDSEDLYFIYNSLTTPSSVFKYNLTEGSSDLYFQKKILAPDFSPENYSSDRIWITANDGTKVAVSLVYKKGLELAKAPLLLYGYGSYGITIPDVFNPYRLSLLNRGFVYAIAHIRGEKYLGEEWYENGKFLHKRNTFTDFINAAEYLGMKGYCDKDKIYAQGGSAGGLLMGAVTNMAPYLWKGIVAQVPFVDVVTTMLDETIPLTVGEYEEWGNPNEEDYYWYMQSYSPYDNVKKMDYPAMYITTGYHDSQVQYWEPLKWVAKIRELRTNSTPILFDCNLAAGHGGGSGRTIERNEKSKEYAFLIGMEK
jgi:oligopeptidase B